MRATERVGEGLAARPQVEVPQREVDAGERVRIDGWLVQVNTPDGWRWRSSLTREDSGGGACEVVYVCSITRE